MEQLNNYDVEAEILASLINSGDKFTERFKELQAEDFTFPETKTVFELIKIMVEKNEPVDISGITQKAQGREAKEAIYKVLEKHTSSTLFNNQLFRLKQLTYSREVNKLNSELSGGKITPEEFRQAITSLPIPGNDNLPQPLAPQELFSDEKIISISGNYLIRGALHLISSDPGTGKTTFLYHLATALSEGREFLGEKLTPLRVAYFDLETPRNVRSKTLQLLDFKEDGNLIFFEEKCEAEKLYQVVEKYQIDLIIIDTVSLFFSIKKEEDNAEVNNKIIQPLKELTKKTGVAIILAHHNSKASKERSKAYRSRGASALPGGVDIVINLENTEEDDIRKLEIAKNRITGYTPRLYILREERELSIIDKPDSEYTKTQKAEEYILAILEKKEAETRELIEKTGYSRITAFRAIENLLITGKIEKIERGKYRIKNKSGDTDDTNDTNYLKHAPEADYTKYHPKYHQKTDDTNSFNSTNIFNLLEEENSFPFNKEDKEVDNKNKHDDTNETKETKYHDTNMILTMILPETSTTQGLEVDSIISIINSTHDTNCEICSHEKREEIEYYLNCGLSTKRVSEKYGIPQGALREHMFKHFENKGGEKNGEK